MKRFQWIFIAIAILALTVSCKKKVEETEPPPVPVATTPTEEVESEPVIPVKVEDETAQPTGLELLEHLKNSLEDVYFDFDKSDLREDTRATLQRHARVLSANPTVNVLVEGHCDERGTEEYNVALGERRAERVRSYLTSLGVDNSRMKTVSYGEIRPRAQGHDESAWAENRRSHFVLSLSQ